MSRLTRRSLGIIVLLASGLLAVPSHAADQSTTAQALGIPQKRAVVKRPIPVAGRRNAEPFIRTELYFGTAKPDGVVTDEEFHLFLDTEITPRFPDGLTLLKGDGQF